MSHTAPGGPDATAHLSSLTDLLTPFAVRVAASLRLPDLIASGVDTLDRLAPVCGADRDALGRLLRYLVHRGVFVEGSTESFTLTETGRLLCDDHPHRGWLDLSGLAARMDLAYSGLLHCVRTGEPGYPAVHGRTFWEDLDANPDFREWLDDLMSRLQSVTAPQIATLYDWGSVGHLVDVAGGSGGMLLELLRAHPHLRGTLVERPVPVQTAQRRFTEAGMADRVRFVVGDFFADLPPGGDVYTMSRALTDWNDRDASAILRRFAKAAGSTGRVLVVEVLPTQPHVKHASPFDLQMLAVVGGRERSIADFAAVGRDAGLVLTRALPGENGLTLVEFAAAGAA